MKKIVIAIGLLYIISSGCKKDYLDINDNPNNPDNASPELVLPNALNVTAGRQINTYTFISGWMGQWAISGSYAPSNSNFTTYRQTTDFGNAIWTNIYNNLEDYEYTRSTAHDQSKPFFEGAAMIMKSYEYQQLIDMFGNIPYTQSLQNVDAILPTYDDASSVYEDLVKKIDTGISLIKVSGGQGASASSDIMFSGDVTSWVQFANTLKLRILMRQSEVKADYVKSAIAVIMQEGSGFLNVDANVNPGYQNATGKQNPFWSLNYNTSNTYINDFWRASQFGIDFYNTNDENSTTYDPRGREVYGATPGDDTLWQGNDLGAQGFVGGASSIFGPGVLQSVSQPATILTAAESYFLQAEAVARGWLSGDGTAQDLYHQGITESFRYYNVDNYESAAADYYNNTANSKVYWGSGLSLTSELNLIVAQKWAAENTATPFEEWCDYRRLPTLPFNKSIPLSKSTNVDELAVPLRILYPTSEYASNSTNVKAQNQGSDAHHTDKIFWMP